MKISWIPVFFCFFFLLSCSDDDELTIPLEDFFVCHTQNSWDTLKFEDQLLGKWEWAHISCFSIPNQASYTEYEGLTVEFLSDNSVLIQAPGESDQNSSWKLISNTDGLFSLEVTPFITQIQGRILFCENQLQFFDSYIDGCDNTFLKR